MICYNIIIIKEGGYVKMNSALDVSRYIINKCNSNNYYISNLRLQKILYFIQMEFIIEKNKKCFDDEIQAWDYGPVVPNVYHVFKRFGASNIPPIRYYYDRSQGLLNMKKIEFKEDVICPEDRKIIDKVIVECSAYSTSKLVDITHSQPPWRNAYHHKKNSVISNKSIKRFVSQQGS